MATNKPLRDDAGRGAVRKRSQLNMTIEGEARRAKGRADGPRR
jgi:hypothetical protein